MPKYRLLKTLFPLLSMTTSAAIRSFILKTILSDVKNANAKTQNHKFNRMVQGLLFDMIERSSTVSTDTVKADYSGTGAKQSINGKGAKASTAGREAMWAVKLACELWRKGIWRDARTANLLAAACFHSNTKVQSVAMHFFLNSSGSANLDESDNSSDDETVNEAMSKIRKVKHQQTINKKKRSTERAAKQEIKRANAKRKAAEAKEATGEGVDNSALNLLHDPQSFVERLYELLSRNDKKFTLEHKVIIMQLYGRACALHRLCVLSFYSYIVKYLAHSQLQITTILVALASSVHELVPPDALTPVIRKLAHEFVHPGVSSQVVAAGINAIREICRRQQWAMEHDLLEDLVAYRKSRDKGVMVAARSLLQLYREVNPELLRKRERGKTATVNALAGKTGTADFGKSKDDQTTIEGLGLLQEYLNEQKAQKAAEAGEDGQVEGAESEEEENDGWEVDSSASSDASEDGWIAVSSDEEGGDYFDDSEDEDGRKERRAAKRAKLSEATPVAAEDDKAAEDEGDDTDRSESDDEDAPALPDASALELTADELSALDKDKDNIADPLLTLATSKILTPADFARLNELRTAAAEAEVKAGGGGAAKRKLALLQAAQKAAKAGKGSGDGVLTEAEIIGASKKSKADYEERLASIAKGREGREKFGSAKGKKKQANPSSSTNKEKRKKTKAFAMVAHSREVRGKSKGSLRAKQRRLQGTWRVCVVSCHVC